MILERETYEERESDQEESKSESEAIKLPQPKASPREIAIAEWVEILKNQIKDQHSPKGED